MHVRLLLILERHGVCAYIVDVFAVVPKGWVGRLSWQLGWRVAGSWRVCLSVGAGWCHLVFLTCALQYKILQGLNQLCSISGCSQWLAASHCDHLVPVSKLQAVALQL
jgi:hypothetical protein